MEPEDLSVERVGGSGSSLVVPGAACVGGVIKLVRVRDEKGSVGSEFVVVKHEETFAGEKLLPTVPFVRGLPHAEVSKADKDGLQLLLIMIVNFISKCSPSTLGNRHAE